MRLRTRLYLLSLIIISFVRGHLHQNGNNHNPYKVLGVNSDASQEEIRRRYRELCLKYHPDKNRHCSDEEQQRCEEQFKRIQKANSEIGDPESRQNFDHLSAFQQPFSSSPRSFNSERSSGYGQQAVFEEMLNAAFRPRGRHPFVQTTPIYGWSFHDVFSRGGPNDVFLDTKGLKSTFVQHVQVPLQDLYSGKDQFQLTLKCNLWQRYMAAFRGGIGYVLLYQSLLFSIPLIRLSRWFAAVFGLCVFHTHLPEPSMKIFHADLKAGYKGNTRLSFKNVDSSGVDVVFIIIEGKHPRYQRIGNDLHVTASICPEDAKNGTLLYIDSLDELESPLEIDVAPGSIRKSGETLTVKDKGWPNRGNENRKGDLIIHFKVRPSKRKQGKRRKES